MQYSNQEQIILKAIKDAREVQEFLWDGLSITDKEFNLDGWIAVFSKRLIKISNIDINHPNAKVELKKRILQQAALSIAALEILHNTNP